MAKHSNKSKRQRMPRSKSNKKTRKNENKTKWKITPTTDQEQTREPNKTTGQTEETEISINRLLQILHKNSDISNDNIYLAHEKNVPKFQNWMKSHPHFFIKLFEQYIETQKIPDKYRSILFKEAVQDTENSWLNIKNTINSYGEMIDKFLSIFWSAAKQEEIFYRYKNFNYIPDDKISVLIERLKLWYHTLKNMENFKQDEKKLVKIILQKLPENLQYQIPIEKTTEMNSIFNHLESMAEIFDHKYTEIKPIKPYEINYENRDQRNYNQQNSNRRDNYKSGND